MAIPPKVRDALTAMKNMGFNSKEAANVLKSLLEVYDNNWELIEENNYQVLLDKILEEQEAKAPCVEMTFDDAEPCLNRFRKPSEKNTSRATLCSDGLGEASLKKPNLHVDVYSESTLGGRASNRVAAQVNNKRKMSEPSFGENKSDVMSPYSMLGEKTTSYATPSNHNVKTSRIKSSEPSPSCERPKHDLSSIECRETRASARARKMRDERETVTTAPPNMEADDSFQHSPQFEVPIAMVFSPNHPNHTGKKAKDAKEREGSSHIALENGWTSELATPQDVSSDIDVVSSDNGEVNLKFCFDTNQPHLRIPTVDAIIKLVEERCLKTYRTLQPDFSVMKVMKEMVQCALELGTEQNMVDGVQCISNGLANGCCASRGQVGSTSRSLEITPQPQIALGDVRPPHDPNDITKGEEKVRISVVNDFSSEKFPPSFYYIPKNSVSQNAYVNFSLARIGDEDCCSDCFGDCVAATIPCACARETGGEFAYTSDGLIKEAFLDQCISMNQEPQKHHHFYCKVCPIERSKNDAMPDSCKGHLVRKFIKECWNKCGCNKQCGNRVVQRGITCNLQVFYTPEGKGWGLRTLDGLPRGTFVCEYIGEILTNMELYDRTMASKGKAKHTYPVLLDADWGSEGVLKDEEALCLDATFYGNVGRFVNHRCVDSNLVEIPVEVETPDHHYYHLAFFTTRKVEPYEELNWDYGIDFGDRGHPVKAFKCRCGSKFCRDVKRSRTRSKALAQR